MTECEILLVFERRALRAFGHVNMEEECRSRYITMTLYNIYTDETRDGFDMYIRMDREAYMVIHVIRSINKYLLKLKEPTKDSTKAHLN